MWLAWERSGEGWRGREGRREESRKALAAAGGGWSDLFPGASELQLERVEQVQDDPGSSSKLGETLIFGTSNLFLLCFFRNKQKKAKLVYTYENAYIYAFFCQKSR